MAITSLARRFYWVIACLLAAALLAVGADYFVAWERAYSLCNALAPGTEEDKIRSAIQQPAHHAGLVAESRTTTFQGAAGSTAIATVLEVTFQGFLFARLSCTVSATGGKVESNRVKLPAASKQQIEIQ